MSSIILDELLTMHNMGFYIVYRDTFARNGRSHSLRNQWFVAVSAMFSVTAISG